MNALLLSSLMAVAVNAPGQANGPLLRKAWFGAGLAAGEKGVKLTSVVPGSTAEAAGLRADDVVTAINGTATGDVPSLTKAIATLATGGKVKIAFLREGKSQTFETTVRPRPADNGPTYETVYDQVASKGNRIRIFVTKPKTPGKHPVLFLIQGIGYVSNEQPLTSTSGYGRICRAFSDKGYVTVRVEKPGLGDSEGGPADKVDFDADLDSFRQALLKTKTYDFVDPEKIVIFGHSMGGCEGPILASEIPVRGLSVYGTVIRSWHEYTLDMYRNQTTLSGGKASSVDGLARQAVAALHLIFNEGLSPKEAKDRSPKWAAAIDTFMPDGEHMSGMGLPFWRGCYAENFASYWEKLDTNVLSLYGACDFVAERIDHPIIADTVNKAHPGKARFVEVPNTDHAFRNVATKKESQEAWTRGGKEFNPAILDVLTAWADEVTGS
ncbi:alpha/beta fold hydrolase [bacterium]|nr:MAG: alpha/beta fold hydrolase [bacterium]